MSTDGSLLRWSCCMKTVLICGEMVEELRSEGTMRKRT